MVDDELLKKIDRGRLLGLKYGKIRELLVKKGYNKSQIDEAIMEHFKCSNRYSFSKKMIYYFSRKKEDMFNKLADLKIPDIKVPKIRLYKKPYSGKKKIEPKVAKAKKRKIKKMKIRLPKIKLPKIRFKKRIRLPIRVHIKKKNSKKSSRKKRKR